MSFLYFLEGIRTPFLDKLMGLVTNLGGETLFIAAAIIIFWCLDKKCGYYMLTVGFSGVIISQFLKLWYRIPRPWVVDPDFTIVESARADAAGYSFPSGHTQTVFATLGAPARYTKKLWLRIILIVFLLIVPFSRMYVGVHTPLDVGVAFATGLVLVFVLYPVFEKMDEKPGRVYVMFSIFILLSLAFVLFVEFYRFPADIDMENYTSGVKNAYMILASSIALLITYHVDRKHLKIDTEAVWWAQIIKLAVGAGVALAIKSGLKEPLLDLFNGSGIAHAVRYFLLIIFCGIIWPMTFPFFKRLGKKQ